MLTETVDVDVRRWWEGGVGEEYCEGIKYFIILNEKKTDINDFFNIIVQNDHFLSITLTKPRIPTFPYVPDNFSVMA
jgi:hypothetical protein